MLRRGPAKGREKPDATQVADWHKALGSIELKAERATDSLERMLAVVRVLISFLTTTLKSGTRWADTPSVILGQHHLTHRDLSELHRGDPTRVYVQELCSYDPQEEPIEPAKYSEPGHNNVAKWVAQIVPIAHARLRKEGLVGGAAQPYLEVQLTGEASLEMYRHDERYTITLPSLILASPLEEDCPLDFDGKAFVTCPATGLHADLRFKAWRDASVTGQVHRMVGDGAQKVARIEGNWDSQVLVYSTETDASGVLFDNNDNPPPLPIPTTINLARPGPRMMCKFWSAVLESILYADRDEAASTGKRAANLVALLESHMNGSLMYESGKDAASKAPKYDDEDARLAAKDSRPLPPACRVERARGRVLRYQVQHLVQSLTGGGSSSGGRVEGVTGVQEQQNAVARNRIDRLVLPHHRGKEGGGGGGGGGFNKAQSSIGATAGSVGRGGR